MTTGKVYKWPLPEGREARATRERPIVPIWAYRPLANDRVEGAVRALLTFIVAIAAGVAGGIVALLFIVGSKV